jgi:hypothetical protein
MFSSFLGAILIANSEINNINHCTDRNYVRKQAYLGSDWSLQTPCGSLSLIWAKTCREGYTPFLCNSIFVYIVHTLIRGISMVRLPNIANTASASSELHVIPDIARHACPGADRNSRFGRKSKQKHWSKTKLVVCKARRNSRAHCTLRFC